MNAIPQAATLAQDCSPTTRSARRTVTEVEALYQLPLMDLIYRAQQVHRENFDANAIQRSTLLSVKTGGCSEDCGYCSQAARYTTGTEREALLPLDEVIAAAQAAKDKGASRFCMGAAWRGPKDKDLAKVTEMIRAVKGLGLQTCVTLGMLKEGQADELKEAGLDYYNHNLDTDASFYGQVITTHKHADRIDTLGQVREAGLKVCSGGIIGMGESRRNRAALIVQLLSLIHIWSRGFAYATRGRSSCSTASGRSCSWVATPAVTSPSAIGALPAITQESSDGATSSSLSLIHI